MRAAFVAVVLSWSLAVAPAAAQSSIAGTAPVGSPALFAAVAAATPPDGSSGGTPAAREPDALPADAPSAGVDWRSMRRRLAELGVSFAVATASDVSRTRATWRGTHGVARVLVDGRLVVDLDRLVGWRGATASIEYDAKEGANGAAVGGDNQGFSNIDADSFRRIAELWIEQWIVPGRLRVKVGRMDANREFAAVDAAADFLNSSLGYSPTILAFPTYPEPRLGVVVAASPSAHLAASVALFDGPDGDDFPRRSSAPNRFVLGELRSAWALGGTLPGGARLGAWRHTGDVMTLDAAARVEHGTWGPYFTIEQTLWRESTSGRDDGRHVGVFVQYGEASEVVSEIDGHFAAGLLWRGPFAPLSADELGVAMTRAHLSTAIAARTEDGPETAIEAFYKHRLSPWLSIQPDVQYVVHPAGIAPRHSALLVNCRLSVEF